MTWTVFVLTIQIERRQCYLPQSTEEHHNANTPSPLNLPSELRVVLRRWKLLPSQSHRGSRLQKPKPLPAEQSPLGGFDFSFCSSKVSNNNNVFKRTGQWRLPSDISSSPIYSKNSNKKECEVRSLHKYLANWILWTLSYIWETINTHLEAHCQIVFLFWASFCIFSWVKVYKFLTIIQKLYIHQNTPKF